MTTRTRAKAARKAAATVTPQRIPADMMGAGFVAVPIRFPDQPTAHRVVHVRQDDDQYQPWQHPPTFTRPAWNRDDTAAFYELTAETAHARGAVACPAPACFGGTE